MEPSPISLDHQSHKQSHDCPGDTAEDPASKTTSVHHSPLAVQGSNSLQFIEFLCKFLKGDILSYFQLVSINPIINIHPPDVPKGGGGLFQGVLPILPPPPHLFPSSNIRHKDFRSFVRPSVRHAQTTPPGF